MIGIKGSYLMKKKYKRWDNPDPWSSQRLHLDLLSDTRADDDGGETGVYYHFEFIEDSPAPDAEHHWFRVGRILDFDERSKFEDFLDKAEESLPDEVSKGKSKVFRRNLERLYPGVTLRGSTPFEARNAERIRRWLIMALLKGAFGRASDNLLRDIRANLQGVPGTDFPVDQNNMTIAKTACPRHSTTSRSMECLN